MQYEEIYNNISIMQYEQIYVAQKNALSTLFFMDDGRMIWNGKTGRMTLF